MCSAKFRFYFLNARKAGLQVFWQGTGQFIFRDPDRLMYIPQRILGKDSIFGLAQYQPDCRLVIWVFDKVIYSGAVKVHLSGIFGFKVPFFQFNDDIAAKLEMKTEDQYNSLYC